jgi:intracellular septation protein
MTKHSLFSPQVFKRVILGTILEFGPIFVFLLSFSHFRIYMATTFLMLATIISTIATYALQKRLPYLALYVTLITIIFGYMTLLHREPRFIQMRDTLYDLTCAGTLLIGLALNIPFLSIAFNKVIPMTRHAWQRLTYAWMGFFLLSALLNEYVRRTESLREWFHYKGYMVIVTVIFGLVSLYLFYETQHEAEKEK